MKVRIHRIGRSRDRWWLEAEEEYLRRLAPLCRVELKEYRAADVLDPAQCDAARQLEGERLLKGLAPRSLVIALDERGIQHTSPELAGELGRILDDGQPELEFLIGGAYGLSESVRARADRSWALSRLTFPHQMVRVFLIEQLYRALMIRQGTPYHK
ncbi:MAG: 23S rRNA (pseudouridine(1915)-N(3))-methyltransferase RlmH [Calditrichaeota bacterium]|nr:23S rRNA (pseudouridine(1915)-N(3))-methyltransferase RlmH [Calditrichota bacterium]MCB9472261.1 23S rRNA (pseudouridine(1915)-N(3))-methyltransferase RlmH [Candidatus Delongbacteria bacterium]